MGQLALEHRAPRAAVPALRRAPRAGGHEHNFQHAERDGIHYIVTGGAGKLRPGTPAGFSDAGTVKWKAAAHFLLVRIAGERAEVTPIGENGQPLATVDPQGRPADAVTVIGGWE